jgi:AcrR family transcriptional regulator
MPRKKKSLEPQQERSRESSRKLLKAAAEVLGQQGVEGTTIPRIAHHAGLTPGAVYRRFRDKDELLETMIIGILERQDQRVRTGMSPESASQIPLTVFAEQMIGGMVTTYRMNAPLLRAIRHFVQGRANTPFWTQAIKLEAKSFDRALDLFMVHRDEIRHPDPRGALSLGLVMVISTLVEIVVMPQELGAWKRLLPKDDPSLKRELTRAFLSYLDIERGIPARRGRTRGSRGRKAGAFQT